MQYKLALDARNKLNLLVQVLASGASIPANFVALGSAFNHEGSDPLGENNHVIFQHVRDALYTAGYQNTQAVHITWPGKVVATAVTTADKVVNAATVTALTATTTPASVSRGRLKWTTDNDKVAAIDNKGNLIARAPGKTTGHVQVVDGGVKKDFKIEVKAADYVAAASVTIAPLTPSKVIGQTQQFTPTVLPANASDKSVRWSSSDATKVTVNATTGLATAVAAGTATITATTNDGAKTGTTVMTVTAS